MGWSRKQCPDHPSARPLWSPGLKVPADGSPELAEAPGQPARQAEKQGPSEHDVLGNPPQAAHNASGSPTGCPSVGTCTAPPPTTLTRRKRQATQGHEGWAQAQKRDPDMNFLARTEVETPRDTIPPEALLPFVKICHIFFFLKKEVFLSLLTRLYYKNFWFWKCYQAKAHRIECAHCVPRAHSRWGLLLGQPSEPLRGTPGQEIALRMGPAHEAGDPRPQVPSPQPESRAS